ncbi:MAG: hypothetical protein RL329_2448 [Bacteroidota bacterium]|jgi:hypothetical protein
MTLYKKYAIYAGIAFLLMLVAYLFYTKRGKSASQLDFSDCPKIALTVMDTKMEKTMIEVPLTCKIVEQPVVQAPAQNDLQKLARNIECGLHRDVSFLVLARIQNTSAQKGVFKAKFTVEMDNQTVTKDFWVTRNLEPNEESLFTTEVFQAKCSPEPKVKQISVTPPLVKQMGEAEVKVERAVEVAALKIKNERKIVILRQSPSFDKGAESEFQVNAGDTLVYLNEKGQSMKWAKEGIDGQFLRVRTLKAPNALWIFSAFVDCLD